jgi:hypothetical protein
MQNWEMLQKAYYRKITTRGLLKQAVVKGRISADEFNQIMAGSPFPEDAGRTFTSRSSDSAATT